MTSRAGQSRFRLLAVLLVLLLTALGAAGCTSRKKTPPEQIAAVAFLDALGGADSPGAAKLTTIPSDADAAIKASLAGLGSGAKGTFTVTGLTDRQQDKATAGYSASWTVPGISTPWTYTGSLPMLKQNGAWLVSWSASDLHPQLTDGTHLTIKRTLPVRAALQDSAGQPLFGQTPVVTVGIHPSKVTNLTSLAATLSAVLKISAADIIRDVKAAQPEQFVFVITLRKPAYEQVRSQIHELPGTEFHEDTQLLAPTPRFAQPMLGRVGPATKEIVDASKGRIQANDQTGMSGLQRALDAQLSGTAGIEVYAAADADNAPGTKLASVVAPVRGTPVKLTLNRQVQLAADAALDTVPATQQAAIVALQPSTGKILAVANSAASTDNFAMVGQYPAGSTFKIVTYTAAFISDPALIPASPVACPGTVNVDGRTFENENRFVHPTIPVSAAFAYSCNTTAINVALKLPSGAMQQAAAALGLGAKWDLPVPAFSGSLPPAASQTELAADAIGQGKVSVSPLLMASIAGAAAKGTPVAPSLLDGKQAQPGKAFSTALTTSMNTLLRATVAQPGGTGAGLADLPGEVRGKTGTAEFGTDTPPKSHSWFAGSRGDLAFAVFIYGGESSHTGATPLGRV
jgi:cell division protein FtsI/penicillin-binding protein 2